MPPFTGTTYSAPTTVSIPSIHMINTRAQLTGMLHGMLKVARKKGWDRVKSGSVVFGDDTKRQTEGGGLEVVSVCAFEWEVDV